MVLIHIVTCLYLSRRHCLCKSSSLSHSIELLIAQRNGYVPSATDYSAVDAFGYCYQVPQGNPSYAAQPSYAADNSSGSGLGIGYDNTSPQETDLGSTHYNVQTDRYDCHACARPCDFGRLQELKRHIGLKHNIELVGCSVPGCKEKFPKARPDYMRRHLNKDH
jgi:hypothetical protein